MADLSTFFRPRGVAVIGASRDPNKLGYRLLDKLIRYKYRGQIYPVNPKAEEILGLRSYASVTETPDPLDLAVIIVPARYVAGVLSQCVERGIPSVVIISGGFRETGPEGAAREAELKEIIQQNGVRVIGPNCVGLMDTHTPLNVTFLKDMPEPGEIGFLSHSGALCAAVINWARQAGIGFSRIVSLGNQADVTQTDMLTTFVDDPQTRVITLYLEGVDDGPAFIETARQMSLKRPILAIKAGTGEAGARAVSSHTGALAGKDEAYSAAFRRAGVLRAATMEELFGWARALAWQPLPKGNRVGVLTNAGGLGVLATDAIEAAGLKMAQLTDETKAFLRERTPFAASIDNPVDVLGGSGSATYGLAMDALLRDPNVDVVCVLQAPADWFSVPSLAEVVGEIAGYARKPVLACMMGLDPMDEAAVTLRRRYVPNYTFPEQLGPTLAAMWARKQWLNEQEEATSYVPAPGLNGDAETAEALLRRALAEGRHMLLPEEAHKLMAAYGIPTPDEGLAPTPEDAAALADEIGYPVVIKIVSPDIVHKLDVNGVALDLRDTNAVRAAAAEMLERAHVAYPDADIRGVNVQQMLTGGIELIVGVTRDPQFGPLVVVGSGGTAVELTRDVAFDLTPLTPAQAGALLDQTTIGPLLDGYRGAPAYARRATERVIARLGQLAADQPLISEIEINPVIALPAGDGALAVDVRVLLRPDTDPEE